MESTTLTTTLSELNRLYGVYVEATEGGVRDAMRAWIAYEAAVRMPSAGARNEPPPTKIRVLLVDDHALVRQGVRMVLDFYPDLEVGEASNGKDALAVLDTFKPSVVITDINMPRKNGVQTTLEIRSGYPHIKAVDSNVLIHQAMSQAGAAKVLSKEAAFEELYKAIRTVLE